MCTVWEGPNSFPKAWCTQRLEGQYSHYWGSHFRFHKYPGPQRFLLSHRSDMGQLLSCSPSSARATPHQLTEAVTTQGCQRGPPDCEAAGSDRYVAWRWAVTVPCIQRGQQPGRALSVTAWPPVCEGRQIPFHEAWHGKQVVHPYVQKHLSGGRKKGEQGRPQVWM